MPLYLCSFCDYNTIEKYYYYAHSYKHISEDNIKSFTDEEIQLCNFYYNKRNQKQAKYRNNNKEKIKISKSHYNKETYRNYYNRNRDKKLAYNKAYRQKIKLGKQENDILIDDDDDEIIIEE